MVDGVTQMGAWGGNGGYPWDMGPAASLVRIQLRHGECIDGLRCQYERFDGVLQWSQHCGGTGGSLSEIVLEKGEFLTFVFGHSEMFYGSCVVRSLTLISNIRKHGPYGRESGTLFCLPQAGKNMIIGFHGRAAGYIDSFGVYLAPIKPNISTGDTSGNGGAKVTNEVEELDISHGSLTIKLEYRPIQKRL